MREAWSAVARGAGLALFVLALSLIAIFWPFGGGMAQRLLVDSMTGAAHGESIEGKGAIQELFDRVAPNRTQSLPEIKAAPEDGLPQIENAAYRVFIVVRDQAQTQMTPGTSRFVRRAYSS